MAISRVWSWAACLLAGLLASILVVGCSLGRPAEGSTTTATPAAPTATDPPLALVTSVPRELRQTAVIIIASPLPSDTPPPGSATASPSPTAAPLKHEIQAGDTLSYIIRQYGYFLNNSYLMEQIVALNANVPNVDTLPGPGSIILIPRPTATPIPVGLELTATADAELGTITRGGITLSAGSEIICHEVRVGETIIDIADKYRITVEFVAALNRTIDFSGCDLAQPGGGGECNVIISAGQCVSVPGPTPIPTLTPTPSGDETASPTPTPQPPRVVAPQDGARFAAEALPQLFWLSEPITAEEYYLVVMYDAVAAQEISRVTRASSLGLPAAFSPAANEERTINWSVRVVRRTEEGTYAFVSEFAPMSRLIWEGG